MKNKKNYFVSWQNAVVGLIFASLLSSCVVAGGISVGGLQRSLSVEESFRAGVMLSDYTYYYQGGAVEPEAIIGISNKFQLRSRLWSKADWTEKKFEDAVFWMQTGELGFCTVDGGYLAGPGGEQIGIWYSKRETTTVKQPEPGIVEVYPFDYYYGSLCHKEYLVNDR